MEIEEYRKIMESHGPCGEGADMFRACGTRADVFRTALSPLCTDWLLRSMVDGWGPDIDDMARIFARYVNGGMTVTECFPSGRKVCSQMWTGPCDAPVADGVTRLVMVGCTGTVRVKRRYGFLEVLAGPGTDAKIAFARDGILVVRPFGGQVTGSGCRMRILGEHGSVCNAEEDEEV